MHVTGNVPIFVQFDPFRYIIRIFLYVLPPTTTTITTNLIIFVNRCYMFFVVWSILDH